MDFFQKISVVWQKLGLVQRALLIGLLLTFFAAVALLTYWARRPDMRMLYQEIAPEEAAKITEKISEKGIAYELRKGGTSIYVPMEQVYQLRLDMAKEGLPIGEQGGYKIFDNEKIGISPFVQSVNLKRALQEELAKSIQMIDGVVHARIHIVSPEQTLFTSDTGKTTASVVLRLRAGYKLSSLNIAAITHLVSGSVGGLTSENVTVVDSQGHLLSSKSDSVIAGEAGTVQDYRERVEENLSKKVEDMLTAVLGPGRATVRVSAIIDMNSVSTVTEKLDPKGVVIKEEITSGSETGAATPSAAGEPAVPGISVKDEIIKTDYEVGKTVKQEVVYPGQIKSLKVAAFVDLSVSDANDAGSGNSAAKIMQETDVVAIIQNALGLEDETAIKVVNVKFNRPFESLVEEEPSSWPRYIAIARQASLGIMAICALLVLRMFRGAKSKVAKVSKADELPEADGASGLLMDGEGVPEPIVVRRQIASALEQDPERVKQLFASWLEEKGG
ncbi:MAG: flagellar M-ring protein FliF [Planctomycetes bacterium]|nr:flagellar M-ring protein FliF [Planctomycetota bacterium]MBL7144780.1 flagellar M-ring protein FliF [Phycisphaerae bacterium]